MKKVCLNCHSTHEPFADELTTTPQKLYPDDRAHGYAVGDLCEAFRVDLDLFKLE